MNVESAAPQRDLHEWLAWEDSRLLDCAFGMQFLSAQDLALELSRDPLLILRRILDSEIPAMIGFECTAGSEEEAEFLALALAGAPLALTLRWCTATEDQDDRPEWDELAMYLTSDLRPAMELLNRAGLWFTRADQLDALQELATRTEAAVAEAVAVVLARVDVPTPPIVLAHMVCPGSQESKIDWAVIGARPEASNGQGLRRWSRRRWARRGSKGTRRASRAQQTR